MGGENVDFDGNGFTTQLDALLADPNLSQVESLVIGYWGYDGVDYATPLINAKDSLTGLAELFVGDIDQEEAEISWIENTDLGPLLASLPNLELLKVRGGNELGFSGAHRHEHLRRS